MSRSYDCGDAPAEIDVHDDGCHLESVRREGSVASRSAAGQCYRNPIGRLTILRLTRASRDAVTTCGFNPGFPVHRDRRADRRRHLAARRSPRLPPRRDRRARRDRQPVPRRLLCRSTRRRLPGATLLHALAPPPADGAAAERSLQPADDLRLPVRSRQDLRVPESRRQRAVHLPAALRSARRGHAGAGPRHLSPDADRLLRRRLRERERAEPGARRRSTTNTCAS